jgi:hypothetical protein
MQMQYAFGGCKHSLLQFSSFGTCNKFPVTVSDIITPTYPNIIQRLLLQRLLLQAFHTIIIQRQLSPRLLSSI